MLHPYLEQLYTPLTRAPFCGLVSRRLLDISEGMLRRKESIDCKIDREHLLFRSGALGRACHVVSVSHVMSVCPTRAGEPNGRVDGQLDRRVDCLDCLELSQTVKKQCLPPSLTSLTRPNSVSSERGNVRQPSNAKAKAKPPPISSPPLPFPPSSGEGRASRGSLARVYLFVYFFSRSRDVCVPLHYISL